MSNRPNMAFKSEAGDAMVRFYIVKLLNKVWRVSKRYKIAGDHRKSLMVGQFQSAILYRSETRSTLGQI